MPNIEMEAFEEGMEEGFISLMDHFANVVKANQLTISKECYPVTLCKVGNVVVPDEIVSALLNALEA